MAATASVLKRHEPTVAVGCALAFVACSAAVVPAWKHHYQPFAFDHASVVAEDE